MDRVNIVDRSGMVSALKGQLTIDPLKTAMLGIDMHRGHLDPSVATMPATPEDCERVIKHSKDLFDFARSRNIPVIHVYSTSQLPGSDKWLAEGHVFSVIDPEYPEVYPEDRPA